MALLIGALLLVFWRNNFTFSWQVIKDMHFSCPALFIIEISPFILYILLKRYSLEFMAEKQNIETELEEKNKKINEIEDFAKKVGDGDFSGGIKNIDKNDVLLKSLISMRDNLLATSEKEKIQNWISKGKDIISNTLRLHNNIESLAHDVVTNIIQYTGLIQGSFYLYNDESKKIQNLATYAYSRKKYIKQEFEIGEGLIGQAAFEMDVIYRTEIPDYYMTITSGLIKDKKPGSIMLMPLINEEKLQGILEFAAIEDNIPELTRQFIREISVIIAQTVFNLKMNIKTEKLLTESQALTKELRQNEEQLHKNANEMRITQEELENTNIKLKEKIVEVQNAQKRLYALLENASEVISIYDKDLTIKYESPSVKNILGYKAEDVIGKKGFTTMDGKAKQKFEEMFALLMLKPRESKIMEIQYHKSDGSEIWLESLGRNLLDYPAIEGIVFNTRDITHRKIAEKEQRMRGQMQSLSENSPDMIIRFGMDGTIFYANPMSEIYTGIKSSEIIKKRYNEADFSVQIQEIFAKIIERIIAENQKFSLETFINTPIGEKIMLINAIPELNEDGILETILTVVHDITERKQIELELKDKNKKVEDSINYSRRIQNSILPDTKQIQEYLPHSFILYKPKDVISGDFPWFFTNNNIIYLAAVDCTGHGVPGALLSFIGYFLLNNIVDHDRELSSGEILDLLHENVRYTLKQDKEDTETRDGMDIAFCKINLQTHKLEFAGAHRPLYLVRNNELIPYKGNAKAIGGISIGKKIDEKFVTHYINIVEDDKIFFFSDGLPDQIGGSYKRKYQTNRIKDILIQYADDHILKFYGYFAKDFKTWMGDNKQIDDVLLIGIQFKNLNYQK
ncbi:MAG: PAS domain S-box protein [Bacteroidia bacterium]|nr:PAS domain S-box protein [Bacteroidia bacterium]